jgi:hypothetical protein
LQGIEEMDVSGLNDPVCVCVQKSSSKMSAAANSASDDFHNQPYAQSQSTEEF